MQRLCALLAALLVVASAASGCTQLTTCETCAASGTGCGWCAASASCLSGDATGPTLLSCSDYAWHYNQSDSGCPAARCASHKSCYSCTLDLECTFCVSSGKCVAINQPAGGSAGCPIASRTCGCRYHASCLDCQYDRQGCIWCPSEQMCVPSTVDSGVPGQAHCRGLATLPGQCQNCLGFNDCTECSQQPDCVWCQDTGSCSTQKACKKPFSACSDDCQKAQTCEGCLTKRGCTWNGKCDQLASGALQPHSCPIPAGFDAGSFVGGMVLVGGLIGLAALTVFVYRWYHRSRIDTFIVQ